MAQICGQVRNWPASQSAVMGSSLGGYYATWLAERFGWRAVVINPVVHAERDLASQVGQHLHWHDATQTLDFRPQDVQALRAWSVPGVTRPERYFTLIAKGDELLDWTEMQGHYRNAPGHLLEGGDHALSDFPSYADEILTFLQLKPRA
jgi:predicted esterase YcpF (UPF0227 family)